MVSSNNETCQDGEDDILPQSRLELSVAPNDGSLLTAPLSLILNTATDCLYNDLNAMVAGDPLTFFLPSTSGDDNNVPYTTKSEAMASLSFQQRRHILASRIARRVKSLSHVSALVACNLPTSATSSSTTDQRYPNLYTMSQIPSENELNQITQISSNALEHVRTSWVSADIAQDALYFAHDSLWKIRSHPHDVQGSMEILLKGRWTRMSQDVKLEDRYRDSAERAWGKNETRQRLRTAVRRKMLLGEIGNPRDDGSALKWNIVLEKDGTTVRLFHGKPRKEGKDTVYPMEARLTVLSESSDNLAPWTLLSIQIKTGVKTGESNHQLELSKEQMFGLHQIGSRAMIQEEARAKKSREEGKNKNEFIARPLEKLRQLSHSFSLSWQMEILSSQAEALRKGSWSRESNPNDLLGGIGITVAPVKFYSDEEQFDSEKMVRIKPLAHMAIHFWEIDDRNGKTKIGPIYGDNYSFDPDQTMTSQSLSDTTSIKRLTLEINASQMKGLEVSLSGGDKVMALIEKDTKNTINQAITNDTYLSRNVRMLLSSIQNPFQLSMGNALLSTVVICADRRCHAIVEALNKSCNASACDQNVEKIIPSWMHLSVECGSISVSANITYDSKDSSKKSERKPVLQFRLACDSRSGKFVPTFPRATSLLRFLVSNDSSASEVQQLRHIKAMSGISSDKNRSVVRGKDMTGRSIRDAFLSLTRSIDILSKRVGIGEWDDIDKSSCALREKSIQQACDDVSVSLMSCTGISVVYGIGALAVGVAGGSSALPDIGGGSIDLPGENSCIPTPPLSVILSQELVEHIEDDSTTMRLERDLFGMTASITKEAVTLRAFYIVTQIDSVTTLPKRLECTPTAFEGLAGDTNEDTEVCHRTKRFRAGSNSEDKGAVKTSSIFEEVGYLAHSLNATWKKVQN